MGQKNWVDDTHYRTSNDGGKTSWLYETSGSVFFPDKAVEVAEHHSDGTTDSYNVDSSFFGILFSGGKGSHK